MAHWTRFAADAPNFRQVRLRAQLPQSGFTGRQTVAAKSRNPNTNALVARAGISSDMNSRTCLPSAFVLRSAMPKYRETKRKALESTGKSGFPKESDRTADAI
jgi:hypothetical protein